MTKDQILAILAPWNDTLLECAVRMDQLARLTGHIAESPLGEAVYRVMDAYTKTIADLVDWDLEILDAWWGEHQFGSKPLMIGFAGEDLRPIATIDALAEFIAETHAREAA